MRFLVGTSGFNHSEWRGPFYPDKLKANDMLGYYALRLRAVEVDGIGLPKRDVLAQWASSTPSDFVFVVRASRKLTQLDSEARATRLRSLFHQVDLLGHKIGPVLFRCPPSLRKDVPWLESFLDEIPAGARAAFEFRSRSWYDDDVLAVLEKHKVALGVVDFEDPTKIAPIVPTARFGYFRMRSASYSDEHLERIAERILDQPWTEAYVFFQARDAGAAPKLSLRLLEHAEAMQPVIKPVAKAVLPTAPPGYGPRKPLVSAGPEKPAVAQRAGSTANRT